MAYTQSSTYAGNAALVMLQKLIAPADWMQKGLVSVQTGINKNLVIPLLNLTGSIDQAYASTPSSSGTLAVTERSLAVKDRMVYIDGLNPNTMRTFWDGLSPSTQDPFEALQYNEIVREAFFNIILKTEARIIAHNIWQGDDVTSPAATWNSFKGLLYRLTVDFAGQYVDATTSGATAFTSSNIDDYLLAVYEEVVSHIALLSYSPKIICSYATAALYQSAEIAVSGKGYTNSSVAGIEGLNFRGIPLVPSLGFPNDVLLCTYTDGSPFNSNLHVGFRNVNDMESIVFQRLQANSHDWFFRMDYSAGTQIGRPEDVVLFDAR